MYRHRNASGNSGMSAEQGLSLGPVSELKNKMRRSWLNLRFSRCSLRELFALAIVLGVLLMVRNISQLYTAIDEQRHELREGIRQLKEFSLQVATASPLRRVAEAGNEVHLASQRYIQNNRNRPTLLLLAKSVTHLQHVITVFERTGYHIIREPSTRWDVLWSYDYPFSGKYRSTILNMDGHQKVNHFPGSGFITNKQSLSTSKISTLPRAYRIPDDVDNLKAYAKDHPNTMWVMKSNDHRGIRIKRIDEMNLSPSGHLNFVQEFIRNPFLVDGRKFDIGVYVVITSINPLRVYAYEDEVLLRFCAHDYHPLDVDDVEKYVVLDEYTSMKDLPSVRDYLVHQHFSSKQALNMLLRKKGHDDRHVWRAIRQSIEEVTRAKEDDIKETMAKYPWPSGFFELVRFDFVIDELLHVWLMEVNMSPNLSSAMHEENALMYQQVIFNTLALAGITRWTAGTTEHLLQGEADMRASEQDIASIYEQCMTAECTQCADVICSLCRQCRSDVQTSQLKAAFLEHVNRGNFRRVFPPPLEPAPSSVSSSLDKSLSAPNKVMAMWFRAKCMRDAAWCT